MRFYPTKKTKEAKRVNLMVVLLSIGIMALAIQGILFSFWLKKLSQELECQRKQLQQSQKELL